MRRGQSAIEFLILTGFMLLVFSAFFLVIKDRSAELNKNSALVEVESVAKTLQTEVAIANQVRNGYERTFELPSTINGERYEIFFAKDGMEVSKSEVIITSAGSEYLIYLPVNVTMMGTNYLNTGKNNITKDENGEIKIIP